MKRFLLFCFLISNLNFLQAQYTTNGSAVELNESCIRVTEAINTQVGAAYFNTPVDLSQPFSYSGTMYFGDSDAGADGMTFLLATDPTGQGMSGGGIGYEGIVPSLVVEFDTWQNADFGDPVQDHIAIMSNGIANHNTSQIDVDPVILPNIENDEEHCFTVTWDPASQIFQATLDGTSVTYNGDIAAIFPPGVAVYYGYTGSTGGAVNEQRVCLYNTAELEDLAINEIDPICTSAGVQTLTANLVGGTWGGAAESNGQIDPSTLAPGTYSVSYTLGDLECEYSDEITIEILPGVESVLVAQTNIDCSQQTGSLEVNVESGPEPFTYAWSTGENTNLIENLPAGNYTLTITAANACEEITEYEITTEGTPSIDNIETTGQECNENNELQGGSITLSVSGGNAPYTYSLDGSVFQNENTFTNVLESTGTVTVIDADDCVISQEYSFPAAGFPEVAIEASSLEFCEESISLSVTLADEETVLWSTGETDENISVDAAGIVRATVTNAANCASEAEVELIECLDYNIPNVFTPNNDGTNDSFGLVTESETISFVLRVYSRWGALVYEGSSNWDGNVDGEPFPADVLSYTMEVNLRGEIIVEQGDVTLVR